MSDNPNNDKQHVSEHDANQQKSTSHEIPGSVREPSERLLDKDEDEQAVPTLDQKAHEIKEKLLKEQKENSVRSDNKEPAQRILDKEDTSEEAGV